jgi:hypothetical protein
MMKMKRFFFGAFGLLALASCSNDELTSVNRDGDEIAFSVVTNSATRAADVYCNNNKPSGFEVWATYDGATYIDGDQITYNENNSKWENTSGTRYWPDDEVSFFAHVNAGEQFNWNDGSPKIENFSVGTDVTTQKDLLYAVKKTSKGTDGKAELNFRHALSQIVFQAKNTNPNLYVEISGVSVCKVKNQGTFTYPTDDTSDKVGEHNGGVSIDYSTQKWGSWSTNGTQQYDVTFNTVQLNGSKTATSVSLTNTDETAKAYGNVMLLLPQETTAWDVNSDEAKGKPADQNGTYFLVKCRIFNVAGNVVDTEKDVCLWGENGAENVAIPVALTWEQGKKYIYTFVFGDGNGGYDPDPDDPDPDPTPVLVPITFEVTVDDFVTVTEEEVKMDKPNA